MLVFFICAVIGVWNHGSASGSAVSGYRDDRGYYLSMGHGHYRRTDASEFASILHRERIAFLALGGMLVSGVAAAWLVRRAGLPLNKQDRR